MAASSIRIAVILALAGVGAAVNARVQKFSWRTDMAAIQAHKGLIERLGVSVERFRQLYENEGAVVIDARKAEEFQKAHLDALDILNVPEDQVEAQIARLGPQLLGGRSIVLYCASERCDAAEAVYRALEQYYQYSPMYIYAPGWEGIEEHKLPTAAGSERFTTLTPPDASTSLSTEQAAGGAASTDSP